MARREEKYTKKRKDGRYQLKVTLPNRQVKYVYGKTKKETEQKKSDLLLRYGKSLADPSKITLREWAEQWRTVKRSGLNTGTAASDESLLKLICGELGEMKLSEIRLIHCQQLINGMHERHFSHAYQAAAKNKLSMILEYAVKNDILTGNPAQYVDIIDKPGKREGLTKEQQEAIIKAVNGEKCELLILFCLLCGLRKAEAMAIEWPDIDFKNKIVTVNKQIDFVRGTNCGSKPPKTASGNRTVPVPDRLLNKLRSQRKLSGHVTGEYRSNTSSDYQLKRLCEKIGFKFTLHQLRHSYATNLDLANVPPKLCQYLMGHSKVETTKDVYTHITEEHLKAASDILTSF